MGKAREAHHLRRVAIFSVALTGLSILVVLVSPLGRHLAIPGPLSSPHARLADDCSSCHTSSPDAYNGVLHGLVSSKQSLAQSRLCLECHRFGGNGLFAHARPVSDESLLRAPGAFLPRAASGEIACAACHTEHRGEMLVQRADEQCLVCHAAEFNGLIHPPFKALPDPARRRIAFDHDTHFTRHFIDRSDDAPDSCTACHVPDREGTVMVTQSFDQTCGACHDADLRGEGRADSVGLAFLGLPAVDVLTLEESDIRIGAWPNDADLAETPLTPFLELLLLSNGNLTADLDIWNSVDLLDLTGASRAELEAVGRILWSVKEVLWDLRTRGQAALIERLGAALGDSVGRPIDGPLLGGFSRATLGAALDLWLPELDAELLERGSGSSPLARLGESPETDPDLERAAEAWVGCGGFFRSDLDFTIRYRPAVHPDPLLRAWLETASGAVSGAATGSGPTNTPEASGRAAQRLAGALIERDAVGACGKCHIGVSGAGAPSWKREERGDGGLSVVAHMTHFPAVREEGCAACHTRVPRAEAGPASGPDFELLSPEDCATCHIPESSSARCVTCHDYHAEPNTPQLPPAQLR